MTTVTGTETDGDTTTITGPGTTGPTTGMQTTEPTTGETTGPTTGETTGPTTGETTGPTTGETTEATTGETTGPTTGETGETTGGMAALPGTHRFSCLDIVELGDSDGDGQPDGGAIQALLLENTWAADIDEFRLNVLLSVLSNDPVAGMAELALASGIGTSADDQCREATTMSPSLPAGFDPALAAWQPLQAPGACAEPAEPGAAGFGGTYTIALGALETIHIYAQEADGTVLNCVPGGGAPNAVPLHAIRTTMTVDADGEVAAGELTGCLLATEAEALCSCLSDCQGEGHPDCGGCPSGSVPLSALLGGVMQTENCTNLVGAPAYDLRVRFSTERIASEQPMECPPA